MHNGNQEKKKRFVYSAVLEHKSGSKVKSLPDAPKQAEQVRMLGRRGALRRRVRVCQRPQRF